MNDTLYSAANAEFIAEIYRRFQEDPDSVGVDWRRLFAEWQAEGTGPNGDHSGPSWGAGRANGLRQAAPAATSPRAPVADALRPSAGAAPCADVVQRAVLLSTRAFILIRSYRVRGHLEAAVDPLGLQERERHADLDYHNYGFTDADLDIPIFLGHIRLAGKDVLTLREIIRILRESYCSTVGVEYMHIQNPERRAWIQERVEDVPWRSNLTADAKKGLLKELVQAEGFESFLQVKYTGTKRFGLDGGESTIPCIEQVLRTSSECGVEEVVLGMPHRGRLNVLARTLRKPHVAILAEFQGKPSAPENVLGSGDVKYHLGASADREFDGRPMHLSLTANPSHLEAVNPVVLGKVRAKQTQRGDESRERVMALLLHGDAAFAGQGIVPETFELSQLRGYRTGGTIHVVVNNQIGFTTNPVASRSTPYATDIAKGFQAPIFHVNGDDPEAVMWVADLAARYRAEFKSDVVIDLFCYRRHGHNEGDEPMFTQPLMYKAIQKHPTTLELYRKKLVEEGVVTAEQAEQLEGDFRNHLEKALEESASFKPNKADWLEGKWTGISHISKESERYDDSTAVPLDILRTVGSAIARVPEKVSVNPKLLRQLQARMAMMESGEGIDWATAEALAFGTLLLEGTRVRLSGQDSARGTFSHRHAAIVDQENERRYYPLSEIAPSEQAHFEVMDSPLSEFGVLGFEYGYSLADPHTLVLWEAQFGDFANGAQTIFDQFISSGESKWLRMSGLVVLLPHGFEGQGPEHSSARLDRFLQACAQNNMQVVNCTTPANYFHALRRQARRNFRKPLIVMTPKSLLRHKLVVSRLDEMGAGTAFRRVIGEIDTLRSGDKVRRVILCSGKVYYDLLEERRKKEIDDVAILRVEQFYPWPRDLLTEELAKYPKAEIVWCQEEPANMGGWTFVMRRLEYILSELDAGAKSERRPVYVGRAASASPATGFLRTHAREQELLVTQALTWAFDDLRQPFQEIEE